MIMKFFNVILTDSPCGNPFVPKRFGIEPITTTALATAGIGLLGDVLGGIFGSSSNDSTNKTNLEIAKMNQQSAREANQMNYKIMKEQNAFNLDMWNKQNLYNDPRATVQRLLAAGINPASQFGSATPAGSLSAASSAQMVPETLDYQARGYDMSPAFKGAFQGIQDAYIQSRLANADINQKSEQTHGIQLENEEKERGMLDRLSYLKNMSKREGFLGDLAKTQLDYEVHTFNLRKQLLAADYTNALKQVSLNQENISMAKLQNGLYQVQLAYAPKLNDAQLNQYYSTVQQIKAQIGLINANKLLTDEQRKHEIEKKCGTIIDTGLKGLDFQLKKETKQYLINQAEQTSYKIEAEKDYINSHNWKLNRSNRLGPWNFEPARRGLWLW